VTSGRHARSMRREVIDEEAGHGAMSPDPAPMAAAPFVWRPDGRPDWRVMWESFCDLALHGGPPHRGPAQALCVPTVAGDAASDPEMLAELRRGIWETTGLFAESPQPGWLVITCASPAMATWLAAAIALENVEARAEDDRLLLPAGPGYRLENEVKSIITVVAKTHHYWDAHVVADDAGPEAAAPREPGRSARGIPKPLRVGIGGPAGGGKTALVEGIRRGLAGRLRVAVPGPGADAPDDPALDLVLFERTADEATAAFNRGVVDATIGVVDLAAATRDCRDSGRLIAGWHLLVVSRIDGATPGDVDLDGLRAALTDRRGGGSVVLADLSAPTGADAVIAWLEHELLLGL
jgi:Ni2+-binding GTPase involved in maturation of urease and hydrogenase